MRFLSGFLLVAALLSATAIDSKLKRAFASITPEGLLGHIRALSSDEYGGRGPGTEGERETVDYLIAQCRQMGLRPGNPDGTFTQNVPLWSIRSTGTMQVTANGQEIPMQAGTDYEATSIFLRNRSQFHNRRWCSRATVRSHRSTAGMITRVST